jgi:hypothetical protein
MNWQNRLNICDDVGKTSRSSYYGIMSVYKYVTPDRVDVLRNGRVRFTQAAALNDPFEAHPCLTVLRESFEKRERALLKSLGGRFPVHSIGAGEIMIPLKVRDGVAKFQRELATQWPMLSLTRKRNNLLMWPHYADSHRGFVIGFDDENPFFHQETPRTMSPLMQVQYSSKRPVVSRFEELADNLHEIVFLTKGDQWSYEEELRMFAKPKAANSVQRDDGGFEIYLFDLEPDIFTEIILGHWMSQREKDEIAALAKEKYPQIEVYEARLNETDYDLDIVAYE